MELLPQDLLPTTPPQSADETFMLEALKQACKAFLQKEVPVGAVLVHQNRIIARGHNSVEMLKDATAHAEMVCLTAGSSALSNWRLKDCILYCTLEPCAMCLGAALLARVKKVIYAACDHRHGAAGSWVDLTAKPHPTHSIDVVQGPYEQNAGALMQTFFQQRRAQTTTV